MSLNLGNRSAAAIGVQSIGAEAPPTKGFDAFVRTRCPRPALSAGRRVPVRSSDRRARRRARCARRGRRRAAGSNSRARPSPAG
ncbi:hypothetical protein [Lysobacter gummosus]|uniref:hypothetical protein n=1 Tax=Lysobacter TaxID=68 RepID=UPI003CCD317D